MTTTTRDLPYDLTVPWLSSVRTDTMPLTIAQARESFEAEADLAELVREFEAVQQHYREVANAMTLGHDDLAPVANSAQVTLSFQPTIAAEVLDLNHGES